MKQHHLIGLAAAIVLAVPVAAVAGGPVDKATGGGQTLLGTQGAGNTIAFTAQNLEGGDDAARGQVQFIDRSAGRGRAQEKFHGIVECLVVAGTSAVIGGVERDSGVPFKLRVTDNGEGAAANNDVIFFDDQTNDPMCSDDDEDDDQPELALARGNAQVYDAP